MAPLLHQKQISVITAGLATQPERTSHRRSRDEAFKFARELGYPCMVRPSYVLGGRAMEIVYSDAQLEHYLTHAVVASDDKPVLVDKYLAGATELDVDALCDKDGNVVICGIMEHIEEAGVHSGDSACSLPPQTIPEETLDEMRDWTTRIAKQLKVIGLINVQYCIKGGELYIIEANPRASRTVPFVAKAVGHPIAAYASLLMSGKTLAEINFAEEPKVDHVAVKEVVLPFSKFPGADLLLGPEMRSTGAAALLCAVTGSCVPWLQRRRALAPSGWLCAC
jgi:carbamoyl-phosphate synthase large subunit